MKIIGIATCDSCGMSVYQVKTDDGHIVFVQPRLSKAIIPTLAVSVPRRLDPDWLVKHGMFVLGYAFIPHEEVCVGKAPKEGEFGGFPLLMWGLTKEQKEEMMGRPRIAEETEEKKVAAENEADDADPED